MDELRPLHMKVAYQRTYSLDEIAAMPRSTTKNGYVLCRVESGVWEQEHRLVASAKVGRPLARGETVHHIDGNRANNAPDNLELWSRPHPSGVRSEPCPHCGLHP